MLKENIFTGGKSVVLIFASILDEAELLKEKNFS